MTPEQTFEALKTPVYKNCENCKFNQHFTGNPDRLCTQVEWYTDCHDSGFEIDEAKSFWEWDKIT